MQSTPQMMDSAPRAAAIDAAPPASEEAILPIPDPVHYAAADLDIYPRARRPIAPAFPPDARDARIAGAVTMEVLIDEIGAVTGASVVDAVPPGVFDQAAQDAVSAASFYPAQRENRAVRSRILVRIEFDPARP
ncbi:MAG TPA: energy transducer TonB [Burkholderiales bacterium]|nr:energy transducer TonB [Burkholderiales bacterium]